MTQGESTGRKISDQELTIMLKAATESVGSANKFFNSFSYKRALFQGNYSSALDQGITLLNKCHSLDIDTYREIHKGTPFYWLGTAAFLLHDYETAVFFYDAAVAEDLRIGANPYTNPTPAIHFIQIAGEQQHQAARDLVRVAQARVEDVIDEYNEMSGRQQNAQNFTIIDLREYFLRPAVSSTHKEWRSLATTFVSFFLEWDYRNTFLDLRLGPGTLEPFFLHLFKGCVLFESLLKANPNYPLPDSTHTLGRALQNLYQELGIPHDVATSNTNFQDILDDLQRVDSIQKAIVLTGRIRNSVGHDLGWDIRLDKIQYHQLFRVVAISCLHAIACLYR